MFSATFNVNNKSFKILFCCICTALIIVSGTLTTNYAPGIVGAAVGLLLFLSPEYLIPPLFAAGCVNETGFVVPGLTAARYFSFIIMAAAITACILKKKKSWKN